MNATVRVYEMVFDKRRREGNIIIFVTPIAKLKHFELHSKLYVKMLIIIFYKNNNK